MEAPPLSPAQPQAQPAVRTAPLLRRLWFPGAALVVGLYAGLPWLAPALMRVGWVRPAEAIYAVYSTQCHQLAQRSYFLFGSKFMYSPEELVHAGADEGLLSLRAFRGSAEIGWKVAWSDRMTAMYTGLFLFLMAVRVLRRRVAPLPTWGLLALLLPLAIDGTTHLISDFAGLGRGFRDSNVWLATLTAYRLGPGFYGGDAWGSFNAWMRLLSGALFGLGVAWYAVPRISLALDPKSCKGSSG